jgi:hypothetical protein
MDRDSLITLIKETKEMIKSFEDDVFNQRMEEYSIYRAETSIYLDTISFLEKITSYELNAEEIEAIKTNLLDIQDIIKEDMKDLDIKNEKISTPVAPTDTVDEFKTINFDKIAEEVNNTSEDYESINNFLTNELPA